MNPTPQILLLIAGSGTYPRLVLQEARDAGVKHIHVVAFENETSLELADAADKTDWIRVGQLGRLLQSAQRSGARYAMMAGQITPKNLFDLRPDLKALLLLAKIPKRNAETLFSALADQLQQIGVSLLSATTFLEKHLATSGHIGGPKPKTRQLDDLSYGFEIAKESSRLDIGQSVIIKNGTILAVEAFEGTNECMRRGGQLGRGNAIMVKVSKPNQDMRFDVPVIGEHTLNVAKEASISIIGLESQKTLLLDKTAVIRRAKELSISLVGLPVTK